MQRARLCTGVTQQNAQLFGQNQANLSLHQMEEVSKSKRKLLIPISTRWNSFFDAVKRIAEIPMSELNTLCTKLGVKCFKEYKKTKNARECKNTLSPNLARLPRWGKPTGPTLFRLQLQRRLGLCRLLLTCQGRTRSQPDRPLLLL